MTYNVFSGTLNATQSINLTTIISTTTITTTVTTTTTAKLLWFVSVKLT